MKGHLALASLFATSVYGHTIFQQVYVNGVSQGHLTGVRVPVYDGPITDVTSDDLICNGGINPYNTPLPNTTITVPAGSQFTAEWHHTLAGADPSDSQDPIDPSHKGPVISYLAKIPNALQTNVTGLQWFKIYEDGLDPGNQTWGVDRMIANAGKVTFTIPPCIEAGQYLLRHEVIALHAAVSYPGAQFYMECAQIQITGGGSTAPSPVVSFPGAYAGTDPGVTVNIYYPLLTNYTIPGPSVFSCSGSSGATTTAVGPTSSAKSTSVSTVSTVSTVKSSSTSSVVKTTSATSSSAASTSTATGTVAQYGQCGGLTYSGPTTCVSPFTCTFSSAYYSQCL